MTTSDRVWRLREEMREPQPYVGDAAGTVGVVPLTAFLASVGTLLVAVADSMSRLQVPFADWLFWVGLLVIVIPITVRLLSSDPTRTERLLLVGMLVIATYLAKLLHSPSYFTFYDEFLHERTATDIVQSGHLFLFNPLLPVSSLFPGLEIVTSAVSQITGASVFDSAFAVLVVARLLLGIGLFLVFEEVTRSSRLAGIATLIYALNQNFLFFDSQFAYESLALPLAIFAILAVLRWQHEETTSKRFAVVAIATIAATVVTHHLTSYFLIVFLALWTLVARVSGPPRSWRVPGTALAFAVVAAAFWIFFVASETVRYMTPLVLNTLGLFRLLIGEAALRTPFQSNSVVVAPAWERIAAILSILLTLAIIAIGLWRVWLGRRDVLAVTLGIAALGYPASLALRLTVQGAEESNRGPEFLFLAVAFLGALAVEVIDRTRPAEVVLRRPVVPRLGSLARRGLVACAGVMFVGGLILGMPLWARLPGPYMPAADTRSVEPQGMAAAAWALRSLGPGNRIVADRINRVLMGDFGHQDPVTGYGNSINTWRLFYTPRVDQTDRSMIEAGNVSYLVADERITTVLPLTPSYFESGEPEETDRTQPLPRQYLDKWNLVTGVSRFFDSGSIRMYDVRSIARGS